MQVFEPTGPTLPISSAHESKAPAYRPPPPPLLPPDAAVYREAEEPGPSALQFDNVTFWPRVAASLIDGMVLAAPFGLLVMATLLVMGIDMDLESKQFGTVMQIAQFPMILLEIAYFTLMNGAYGATLGKMALGMRVVRADGSPIGYGLALGRIVTKLVLQNCTCSLFFLSVAINEEHRGWHDQIVGTRVIYVR